MATARPSAAQHPNLDSHCRNTNRRPLVWPVEDGMPGTATGAPAIAPSVSRQTVTSSSEAVAAAGTELDFGPSISPGHRVPPLPTEVLRGCEDNQRDRMVGGDHGVLCGSHTCRQRAGMCGGECSSRCAPRPDVTSTVRNSTLVTSQHSISSLSCSKALGSLTALTFYSRVSVEYGQVG